MTVRPAAALLAVLFTAAPTVNVWAEKAPALRVAVALKSHAGNAENERRLLEGMEVGMKWIYGRKLTVVEPASAPDAVVEVTYLLKPGDPATAKALLIARLDGREVLVPVPASEEARRAHALWQAAGSRLGQDIGVVLKAKAAPGGPAPVDAIVERLAERDPVERAQAANQAAQVRVDAKAVIPALLAVLGDDRPLRMVGGVGGATTPAKQAGNALVALGAHAELIAFVRSTSDDGARGNALVALAIGRSPESGDVILEALGDRDGAVRAVAAGLAGAYAGRRAAPKLIDLLAQDRNSHVRQAARQSLTLLAGKDLDVDAAAWRAWWTAQKP